MIAPDTSVVVAAFASWHEGHEAARAALRGRPARLPGHVALETYSVLTRMPPPHRAAGPLVADFLRRRFPDDVLTLSPAGHRLLVERLVHLDVSGGATYDALVAATAAEAGVSVVSRDKRAASTYDMIGVRYELLA